MLWVLTKVDGQPEELHEDYMTNPGNVRTFNLKG
jgi:ferric-dicitrate binding protein FerR (iron transport regulator)